MRYINHSYAQHSAARRQQYAKQGTTCSHHAAAHLFSALACLLRLLLAANTIASPGTYLRARLCWNEHAARRDDAFTLLKCCHTACTAASCTLSHRLPHFAAYSEPQTTMAWALLLLLAASSLPPLPATIPSYSTSPHLTRSPHHWRHTHRLGVYAHIARRTYYLMRS